METILITGAGRGIGLELARQSLSQGCNIIATYRGAPSAALNALNGESGLRLLPLEVTEQQSIKALSTSLAGQKIDVLVNNAGVLGQDERRLAEVDPESWLDTFAVNTIAPIMLSRALLPNLSLAEKPRIINVSSQMGALSLEGEGLYAYRSSKAALNKASQVLASELAGVVVCPIHPGWVQTDMGGEQADITVAESVRGITALMQQLNLEDSGKFFKWNGQIHDW